MNIFNVHVEFDNPTVIKALMKAEDSHNMREVLLKIFDEVKNLNISSMEDLGPEEDFDFAEWEKRNQAEADFATVTPANTRII